jgi:hypothetical protein
MKEFEQEDYTLLSDCCTADMQLLGDSFRPNNASSGLFLRRTFCNLIRRIGNYIFVTFELHLMTAREFATFVIFGTS